MSVALVIQHAIRMRRVMLSSVASLVLPYSPTLSQRVHDFQKISYWTKYASWFSLEFLPATYLILRRIQRDTIKNAHSSSCKYPLFLSDFNKT